MAIFASSITAWVNKFRQVFFRESLTNLLSDLEAALVADKALTKGVYLSSYDNVAAANAAGVHADITLTASTQNITTGITNPAISRTVSIKGTKAGGSLTGNVVVTGTGMDDEVVTDTLALNDDNVVQGDQVFKTITNIAVPVRVTADDKVSVGFGLGIGIDAFLPANTVILVTCDGAYEATRPTVAYSATVKASNYFAANTTPNGSYDYRVYYIL